MTSQVGLPQIVALHLVKEDCSLLQVVVLRHSALGRQEEVLQDADDLIAKSHQLRLYLLSEILAHKI